mgnify:FL=1
MLESFWGVILVIVLIIWSRNIGKSRKVLEKKWSPGALKSCVPMPTKPTKSAHNTTAKWPETLPPARRSSSRVSQLKYSECEVAPHRGRALPRALAR